MRRDAFATQGFNFIITDSRSTRAGAFFNVDVRRCPRGDLAHRAINIEIRRAPSRFCYRWLKNSTTAEPVNIAMMKSKMMMRMMKVMIVMMTMIDAI